MFHVHQNALACMGLTVLMCHVSFEGFMPLAAIILPSPLVHVIVLD